MTQGAQTADNMPASATDEPAPAPTAASSQRRRVRTRRTSSPSFARRSAPTSAPGRRGSGLLAVAVLIAALALQLMLAQRHALAADARWRPTVAAVCNVLRCQLRPWREPEAFTMLARTVQPASRAGVLQIEASFRNDARWPQPWPRLLLRLSDRHGATVGQRLFAPAEYRGSVPAPALLAPGQSASVRFAVREPAPDVVAFDFDFR